MATATQDQQQKPASSPEELSGLIHVEEAATAPRGDDGKPEVSEKTEEGALAFLLRPPTRLEFTVPVKIDTPDGRVEVNFVLQSLPGKLLRDIEKRNSKDGTLGPLAELDEPRIAAETVSVSLKEIRDPASGASLSPRDERFMVNAAGEKLHDPAMALQARFEFQSGILEALASEVRRISGWGPDRVGTAQRVMVDAVGSSLSVVD